jgi:hypothetical protein
MTLQQVALDRRRDLQLTILQRELLQAFQTRLHLQEPRGKLLDLVARRDLQTLVEVSFLDPARRMNELFEVPNEPAREQDREGEADDQHRDEYEDQDRDRLVLTTTNLPLGCHDDFVLREAQVLAQPLDVVDQRGPLLPEHAERLRALALRREGDNLVVYEFLEIVARRDQLLEHIALRRSSEEIESPHLPFVGNANLALVLIQQLVLGRDEVAAHRRRLCGERPNDLVDRYELGDGFAEDLPLDAAQRSEEAERQPPEHDDEQEQDAEASHDLPSEGQSHRASILDRS